MPAVLWLKKLAAQTKANRIVDRELILHVLDAYQPFGIDA